MDFDRSLARALLRLATGVNRLAHGGVRLPALQKFAQGMTCDFSGTFLPLPLVHAFATALSFVELAIGALLLAGLWPTA